jgi:proteic killer suppression protein
VLERFETVRVGSDFNYVNGWHSSLNPISSEALELAFAKKSLRQVCEREANAKRDLGAKIAEKLRRRLADLRAATCVKDLVAGRPRELKGARHRQIAVDLCEGFGIIFCANHNSVPTLESGGVDWAKVSRIKILRIEAIND